MQVASPVATQFVQALLVACDAAVSQKSAGTLFAVAHAASDALRKYYAAVGSKEVTIAFTVEGVEVDAARVTVPDRIALLRDLARLFEHTIVLSDPGETGLAIFMRRLADEVREPGGGLEDVPGVRPGPPKRVPAVIIQEKVVPEKLSQAKDASRDTAVTAPPPAGWTPALGDEDPFKDLI